MALFNELSRRLSSRTSRCLVLLDTSLRNPADDPDHGYFFRDRPNTPIKVDHPRLSSRFWPQLIELDLNRAADSFLLESSVSLSAQDWQPDKAARGLGHRVGGWLVSSQSADDVATHLAQVGIARVERGGQRWLRLHDPRVLDLIWNECSSAQRSSILGPIDAWTFLARDMSLESLTSSEPRPDKTFRLRFDTEPWQVINAAGCLNQAALQWQRETGQPQSRSALRDAAKAMTRAAAYGIDDRLDLTAFAFHALAIHPSFDTHPFLQQQFPRIRAEQLFYSELAAELPEEKWAAIRAMTRS